MNISKDINVALLEAISTREGSLTQRVYLLIRQAILALDFPPGAIVRKAAISERLGVSRAPVDAAIARLSAEGLVDVVPQSITRVSYFSMDEIRESVFLREALEAAAVGKVARDLDDNQRRELSRNMRIQEFLIKDDDIPGFYRADEAFHQLLTDFTGFPRLSDFSQTVSLQLSRARILLLPTPGRAVETLHEHKAIFEAIVKRDSKGAQAAIYHHLGQLMPRIERLQRQRPALFNENSGQASKTGQRSRPAKRAR